MRDNLQQRQDKQLQGIALESVLEKRRLDQALNAKEFAVCAGYPTRRRATGFTCPASCLSRGCFLAGLCPMAHGQNGVARQPVSLPDRNCVQAAAAASLPPRAARILLEAASRWFDSQAENRSVKLDHMACAKNYFSRVSLLHFYCT